MAEDSSFIWLRPATDMEAVYKAGNSKGAFVTVYAFTIRSAVPLTEELIRLTLLHAFRKMPSLRLCFPKRGDNVWECDMNREEIDFQVSDIKDVRQAFESLLHYRFNISQGPLWCARLLPADAAVSCVRPELAADFPHRRMLLIANNHSIGDGTTNMLITDAFMRILDDVVAGVAVDDSVQFGKLVAGEETNRLIDTRMAELMKDESRLQQVKDKIKKLKTEEKLIPRAYSMPMDPNYKAQIVFTDLDREATKSFYKRCKMEGVTVNSGLAAVFNVGLVDFLREGGLDQDEFHINEMHCIDMRRYWSGDTAGTLGMHMLLFQNIVSTPAKWRDSFWEYARYLHESLGQKIQEKDAVMYAVKVKLFAKELDIDRFFDKRSNPACDYGASNMGNANRLLTHTEGQHVRLTHLITGTSCFDDPMYYMFQTLHGCLTVTLAYANDILTRETAQKLMDITFQNLRAVTSASTASA